MDLEQYVTEFCREQNITKEKLADHANIARSTLYRMMQSKAPPTLLNLTKLAIAMQVHPQYLIKLEWEKYKLAGYNVIPIKPLKEPVRWFHGHCDNSHFIAETVPDGSIVCVNERFNKTWRIQNTGDVEWRGRKLVCQNTNKLLNNLDELEKFNKIFDFHITAVQSSISIPLTKPGETIDLTVEFIAPTVPGYVFSHWKMVNKDNNICFPDTIGVYLQVQVVSAGPTAKPEA